MGAGALIVPPTRIEHPASVILEDGVVVLEHSWLHAAPTSELVLSRGVSLNRFVKIVALRSVWLGPGVITGDRVYISDVEYVPGADEVLDNRPLTTPSPVVIDEGAFLNPGVVVKPGVTIGRHAYVGASSVVTEDVPPYGLAVGNPAKVLRILDPPPGS